MLSLFCSDRKYFDYLQERRSWPKQLDALEQAIKQQQAELQELRAMHNDAQIAKDNARAELSKLEQSLFEAKKERDTKLEKYKKQAEEKREHAEKVERRVYTNYLVIGHLIQCNFSYFDNVSYWFSLSNLIFTS